MNNYLQHRLNLKNGIVSHGAPVQPKIDDKTKAEDKGAKKAAASQGAKKASGKKIKKVSKKRAAELREYKPIRRKFLADNPICGLKLPGCTGHASEVHHQAGREGKRLLDITDFIGACHNCHRIATDQSREAIAAGHSKTRLGKPKKPTQ
jgi:hypothetical protein